MIEEDKQALIDGSAKIHSKIEILPSGEEGTTGKNKFDGYTESGGYNHSTGAAYNDVTLLRNVNPIYVKPNTNYKISNNSTGVNMNILEYTKDGTFIRYYLGSSDSYITTSQEVSYINIYRGTTNFDKVQIEEGTEITSYEPYGKNLFLDENNSLVSWDYEDFRYVPKQGVIGQFVARELKGKLKNISDDFSMENRDINLFMGIKTNEDIGDLERNIEGENITITDSNNQFAKSLIIEGNSEQETTTGKNLFNYVDNLISSSNGLTSILKEDGSIITSGVPTVNYAKVTTMYNIIDELEDGVIYTLWQGDTNANLYIQLECVKNDSTKEYISTKNNSSRTITISKSTYKAYNISIQTDTIENWGTSSKTITNQYMLVKGSSVDNFEKYTNGASPNPDYPQEIKTVRAKNIIDISNSKTYIYYSGLPYAEASNMTINSIDSNNANVTWGADANNYQGLLTPIYNLEPNTEYTLSFYRKQLDKSQRLMIYDYDSTYTSNEYITSGVYGNYSISFTTSSTGKIAIMFALANNSAGYTDEITDIQLEKGPIATEYAPSNCIRIDNVGKNKLKLNDIPETTINGITYSCHDGVFRVNGTATKGTLVDCEPMYIPGGNYFFTSRLINGNTTGSYARYLVGTNKSVTNRGEYKETSYTNVYFRFYTNANATFDNVEIIAQLEEGLIETPYEKFVNNSIDINLRNNELAKINNVKDELEVITGQLTKRIGKLVLTGDENFAYDQASNGVNRFSILVQNSINNSTVLSTHFIGNISNSYNSAFVGGNNRIYFCINYTNLTDFKTWLQTQYNNGTPVEVYYELAEPQTINLDTNYLTMYDSQNNISLISTIKTDLNVSYYGKHWYMLGTFMVNSPNDDNVKDNTEFESIDFTKKCNQVFLESSVTFPCTVLELAESVCKQCGLQLATKDFANNQLIIPSYQYDSDKNTCREILKDIGKLAYSWVRIGWDNRVYIDFSVKNTDDIEENNIITNDNYYDLIKSTDYKPVNRVVIGYSDIEGENTYIEDTDSIAEYGLSEITLYDNNLLYTPELRSQAIQEANRLFGLSYTSIESTTTGHPWLIGNELCEFIDMENNNVYTYPFDITISYQGHIKTKLGSYADSSVDTEYKSPAEIEMMLKRTRYIVDKQEQTITQLVETTKTISDSFDSTNETLQTLSATVIQNNQSVTTEIREILKNLESGVESVKNNLVTIDINGISVSTSLSAISTLITNDTFAIRSKDTVLAYFGYDNDLKKTKAEMDNLTVTNYLTMGYHRIEKYEISKGKRTGFFYTGGVE